MKKIYYWSILILMMIAFLPQWADAQSDAQRATHVTPAQALNVGYTFMRTGDGSKGNGTKSGNVSKQAMQLVYTGQATDSITGAVTDCYYVFALHPKGFVIVAADDRVEPILGYSYDNNFVVENMPNHVRGWLGNYERQIEAVAKGDIQVESATQTKWTRLKSGQAMSTKSSGGTTVGPLLTTTWDQGQYYNAICPEDAAGPDGHVWTGCVATAMAQIINYWGYPVHGRGTHSYECDYGTLTVNYDSANYDYANMPSALTNTSTAAEVNAVATLMRDCGVAANMGYGAFESSTYDVDARAGMINFFRLSPNLCYAEKSFFADSVWEDMLRADIDANRPVMYSGFGTGGHTFVCDGYQQDSYFHFNFGWGGFADGWYLTCTMTPGGMDFSSDQSAIFGIVPDSTGNVILGQMQGTSTFVVDEPLEFYHLMGHNAYTGNSYGNPCNNTVNFVSANNANQLVADIMEFEDQNITIYDGAGTWLRNLCGGCENDLSPIISTGNALNVTYSGNLYYTGFKLIISQNSNCRMVSNIISSVDTTTVHLAWVENGIATQWQVEYGFSGFSLGEGTLVTVSMEFVDINNLVKFTKYDFYIRSVCGDSQYGPWSNVIKVMTEASYWTDVVTSQPEGFVEDSLGNITISSAEGLAWYAYNTLGSNYYGGKHVTLTADIDLSQHMWKPMRLEDGIFDGAGHTIENMFIIEHNVSYTNSIGLFGNVTNGTIKNVTLKNIYISYSYSGNSGYGYVGGIAGLLETYYGNCASVINCTVQGEIFGGQITGGVVGRTMDALIINSASLCSITSRLAGGIVGNNDKNSVVKNCYEGGTLIPIPGGTWYGKIAATVYGGIIENCYYLKTDYSPDFGYYFYLDFNNVLSYKYKNEDWELTSPANFDNIDYNSLVEALNKGVESINVSGLKTWQRDTANINGGFPIYGEEFVVTCPNTSTPQIRNIQIDDNNGVIISWTENGNAQHWQIRYKQQDSSNYTVYSTNNNPDTLLGLIIGENYQFSVRPVCDETHCGAWTDNVFFSVNIPHWTDVVTSQPSSYTVEVGDTITISSSDGLAWFASVVNGLNGQMPDNMEGKYILLISDVEMSQYRWTAIDGFSGRFDGNGHVISGITIEELSNNQGLFGTIDNAYIANVKMHNVDISAYKNVGGLCGYTQKSEIDNCSVRGIVRGRQTIGGLIGELDNSQVNHCKATCDIQAQSDQAGGLIGAVMTHLSVVSEDTPPMNCYIGNSSAQCNVYSDVSGGLLGDVLAYMGDITIENCFSNGYVSGFSVVGGFCGGAAGYLGNVVKIRNCCTYNEVNANPYVYFYPGEYVNGAFGGYFYGDVIFSKCYVKSNPTLSFIGSHHGSFDKFSMTDTSSFYLNDTTSLLYTPITIDSTVYIEAVTALNAWIALVANSEYNVWISDTSVDNLGWPVFGKQFNESCPSILSVQVDSVWEDGVKLKWNNDNAANQWRVEYGIHGFERGTGTVVFVSDTTVSVSSLTMGSYYDFYIQLVCGQNMLGRCDSMLCVKPDKKYWIDVVTSKPEGYQEDDDGNVLISSAEGLAWLISVCNGLNGATTNNFNVNKTVRLSRDVNISEFRWTSIENFGGIFDGLNHTISGLYINDNSNYNSMFKSLNWEGRIKNVLLKNGNVRGLNNVAGLCIYQYGTIENCGVECNVYSNKYAGVISTFNNGTIINSYANGYIYGMDFIGGAIGWNSGIIQNCYAATVLESSMLSQRDRASGRLGQFAGQDFVYDNGNIAYWANTPFNIANSLHATNDSEIGYYSFSGSDTSWMLTTPQMINGQPYSRLVSALNAWVDANNTGGQYRHWEADTAMVNGGFPVFAAIPCPEIDVHDTIVVCDSYTWHGMAFTADTLLTDTLSTLIGCDSVVTHHIIVNYPVHTTVTETACESYEWNGEIYTTSGDYDQTFTAANGCDSIVTLHLTVNYATTGDTTAVACDSFDWYEQTGLTQSGDYIRIITNVNGCDSVVTLHLTITQPTTGTDVQTACGSYTWIDGITYTESNNTATHTLTNAAGCDSVVTLNLTINQPVASTSSATTCDSYEWNGQTYTTSGDYTQTFINTSGCDSVVTLHLTINQPTTGTDVQTACGSFTWIDGITYTESSSTATYTLANAAGCDSVVTLNLTINQPVASTSSATACNSYEWNGQTYTTSGDYIQIFTAANGCDSIVTLHLTVNPSPSVIISGNTIICAGGATTLYANVTPDQDVTYAWYKDGVELALYTPSIPITEGGAYMVEATVNGCSSFSEPVSVIVEPSPQLYLTDSENTICTGGATVITAEATAWNPENVSYIWSVDNYNGSTYTFVPDQTGLFTFTVTATNINTGCQSAETISINVMDIPATPVVTVNDATVCEGGQVLLSVTNSYSDPFISYTWYKNGVAMMGAAQSVVSDVPMTIDGEETYCTYSVFITMVGSGCQSQAGSVTVTVAPQPVVIIARTAGYDATVCEGGSTAIQATVFGGYGEAAYQWYENGFLLPDETSAVLDIDNLTVGSNDVYAVSVAQEGSGCYGFTSAAISSLVTVIATSYTEVFETTCDSYTWNDSVYTQSGDYTQVFTTVGGCDSVVTLHLIVNQSTTGIDVQTACDSFTWIDGVTYTESNSTATYTLTNAAGCDSVVTLNLTLNYAESAEFAETACESFEWNGETFTSSGDYTQTFTNVAGCDSVVTLHLTVNHSVATDEYLTICENELPYTYGDTVFEVGTPELSIINFQLSTIDGCDSVVTLHLTVNHSVATDEYLTICENELPYTYGDTVFEVGTPELSIINFQLSTIDGCDSMVTLHLTVNHSVATDEYLTICENELPYTYGDTVFEVGTPELSIINFQLSTINGCDSVVTLHLTVNPVEESEFSITTEEPCYTWNGQEYCTSGDYTQTLQNIHGCDSVVTLHLTVSVGIDEHNLGASMTVYPNPTTGVVNVQCTMNNVRVGTMEFQLFDAFGRLLRTTDGVETQNFASLQTDTHGSSVQTQIDLSHCAAGTYFVKAVADGNVVAVKKVIKN